MVKGEGIWEMARLDWANQGRGSKFCSYKRITAGICAVNVVAALYVLHSLYTSFFIFVGPSNAPPAFFGVREEIKASTTNLLLEMSPFSFLEFSVAAVKYTDDQIRKMEESIRIRRAAEPIELIKIGERIKAEFSAQRNVSSLSKSTRQMIADEILQLLKGLKANANQKLLGVTHESGSMLYIARDTQSVLWAGEIFGESLEIWRKEKLEEVHQLKSGNAPSNSTFPAEEATLVLAAFRELRPLYLTETFGSVLESEWSLLLEDIGVWIPAEIIHIKGNDTLQNEEEDLDDEIVAGRPLPPECHAETHTDYGGAAVRWGLTHHKESAADCCQACLDQAKRAKAGEMKCNIWVYCPAENGCYSPDIYVHKHQECWLKQAEKPRSNFKDRYSESYRSTHPKAPVLVPWMSGVVG
ncbi:hypothetical protein ACLOJK_013662 [Asimina triloba]